MTGKREASVRMTLLRGISLLSLTLFFLGGWLLQSADAATQSGSLTSGQWAYYDITLATPQKGVRLVLSSSASSDFYLYTGSNHAAGTLVAGSSGQTLHTLLVPDSSLTDGATYHVRIHANAALTFGYTPDLAYCRDLPWDPGTALSGTNIMNQPDTAGGDYLFRITSQTSAYGAWRTVLNVTGGEADFYQQQTTPPLGDTTYKSTQAGSDGLILGASQFDNNQTWYLRVHAAPNATWSIFSGDIYVQDLGAVSDTSSNATATIGREGMYYFKGSVDAATPAWRLWLNGSANQMYVSKGTAPIKTPWSEVAEQSEAGQMLLVPPYLTSALYLVGVKGTPGSTFTLDSRKQAILTPSAVAGYSQGGGAANFDFTLSNQGNNGGFGYLTYKIDVPVQQIAWQVNVASGTGQNADVYLRKGDVPNRWNNDALSEAPAGVIDSITQVPPTLTDGAWYVTVYGTGTYTFTLTSKNPLITGISYINDNLTPLKTNGVYTTQNYQTLCPPLESNSAVSCKATAIGNAAGDVKRSGWQYYQVSDINSQLGFLGWQVDLAGQVAGSEIALRRNAVPARWRFRSGGSSYNTYVQEASQVDVSSTLGFLQHPGHQADIWYVGVNTPDQALGAFQLTTREIPTPSFTLNDGSSQCQSDASLCSNSVTVVSQPAATWKWFKVTIPADSSLLGWDLRLQVTGGTPQMVVRRDQLPADFTTSYSHFGSYYYLNSDNIWSSGSQWTAAGDWTGRGYNSQSVADPNKYLVMGLGSPLQPGTYYVGVSRGQYDTSTTPLSYTLVSRGIGIGSDANSVAWPIQVKELAFSGTGSSVSGTGLAPREAAYYRVTVPAGTKNWSVNMAPTTGEALMAVRKGALPNVTAGGPPSDDTYRFQGAKRQKDGKEFFYKYADSTATTIGGGVYYVAVIGEGQNPSSSVIGTGGVSYTLTSVGEMPVNDKTATPLAVAAPVTWVGENLSYGEQKAYRFRVPEGLTSMEIRLKNRVGNPTMAVRRDAAASGKVPTPRWVGWNPYYASEGGDSALQGDPTLITIAQPAAGDYTLNVVADELNANYTYPDASCDIEVKAVGLLTLPFTNGSVAVTAQDPQSWQYFTVTVPADSNLLGWDLRLQVTGGAPQMVVRRDQLPADFTTSYSHIGSYYYLNSDNIWSSGSQWTAAGDWTGRSYNSQSVADPNKYLVMGLGSPLQPGTYYVGVSRGQYDTSTTPLSYTLVSRGIGIGSDAKSVAWPIQVKELAFSGTGSSFSGTGLAPREAAYYRVTVPAGSKSWSVNMAPTTGEALMAVRKGALPNVTAGGTPSDDTYRFQGAKRQKDGKEFFYKYADSTATAIGGGVYYLAVIGEGQSPSSSVIGTGVVSYTLTSVGEMPVNDKTATPLAVAAPVTWVGENLSYGEQKVYRFRVPEGLTSMEIRLKNRVGNPTMTLRRDAAGSGKVPTPMWVGWNPYYASEGGDSALQGDPNLITIAQPAAGDYTLNVIADELNANYTYPDASCDIEVKAVGLLALPFTNGSVAVTGQDPQSWQYFTVTVPSDSNLLGWDLRLQVTGGNAQMVVRRDQLPADFTTSYSHIGSYYYLYSDNIWNSGSQWTAAGDWTGRGYNSQSVADPNKYLIMGLGSPLQPGTYYIGVSRGQYDSSTTPLSYTLVSRGIGTGSDAKSVAWPIQVKDLAFSGTGSSVSGTGLAPREAAYYRVTVPAGSKSWSVSMAPTTGEALLAVRQGALPNVMAGGPPSDETYRFQGAKRQKDGKEFFYKYADSTATAIGGGVYYLAVIGEGQNPSSSVIGTGGVSYTLTSVGEMPVNDRTATPLAAAAPVTWVGVNLSYGEQKAYRFRVPEGLTSMEIRLKNRVGDPTMTVRRDVAGSGKVPTPAWVGWNPYYASEGGDSALQGDPNLITIAQPAAGDYTLNVIADMVNSPTAYPDASCDIEVTAKAPVDMLLTGGDKLCTDPNDATKQIVCGGHLVDQQVSYYRVEVPAQVNGFNVAGWKINVATTAGSASLRIAKGTVPGGSVPSLATSYPVTIVVPPFLSPGTWYVEVKGAGNTDYTIVSDIISGDPAHNRRSWNMPDRDNHDTLGAAFRYPSGLSAPNIADSGIDDQGNPILNPNTGDQGTDLAENDWHFYRIVVPDNNAGHLKTIVEALSGKPELYIRTGSAPSPYHHASASDPNATSSYTPLAYDRSQALTGTMYGNWVPLDGREEIQLKKGDWWFGVKAVGSNIRYRFKAAAGNVRNAGAPVESPNPQLRLFQDMKQAGGAYTGQTMAAGDLRYYRVTVPPSSTNPVSSTPLSWTLNLQKQVGDVAVFVRDTIPPGQGIDGNAGSYAYNSGTYSGYFQDWYDDNSGRNPNPFTVIDQVGSTTLPVPPVKPGQTYYLGVYARTDAAFDLASSIGTETLSISGVIPFVNGTLTTTLSPGESRLYRIDAPKDAILWSQNALNDGGILMYISQDTVPAQDSSANWYSYGQVNSTWSTAMGAFPWQPGHSYYLNVVNTTANSLPFSYILNGISSSTSASGTNPASSQWNIITYAGGGVGNGTRAAGSAYLSNPSAIAYDASGNLYIADTNNNLVRKVSAATGVITTVAGNGLALFGGDGGPATLASLNRPQGVGVDAYGNIYISDTANRRVRKVAATTGIISTVAGNGGSSYPGDGAPAISASITPAALSLDHAGNVYFVDSTNVIRRIDAASGVITTVAGNGTGNYSGDGGPATSAGLNSPAGIAFDNSGNLFIADQYNNRIRKVDSASGVITTVAGSGANGYGGDNGAATAATLGSPQGIAVDGSGNLYIADSYKIRKVTAATGVITTVAGNGASGATVDGIPALSANVSTGGVSLDAGGNLIIIDNAKNLIRKVDAVTGVISTVAGGANDSYNGDGGIAAAAALNNSAAVATDRAGNLYIADTYNHRIRKVTAATGVVTTVAGNGTAGSSGDNGAATAASLNGPQAVAVDGSGNLYIADTNNNRIRRVNAVTGMMTTEAGGGGGGDGSKATSASLYSPQGIAVDVSGNLYITETYNNRIRKVTAATGLISTVAGNGTGGYSGDGGQATLAGLYYPTAVTAAPSGNLYIADKVNNRIRKVDLSTGIITTVAGTGTQGYSGDGGAALSAKLNSPSGVALDAGGNLYLTDSGNSRLRRVDATTGVITTVSGIWTAGFSGDGGPAAYAALNNPQGIAIDPAGNIFLADTNNDRIRQVIENAIPIVTATPQGGSYATPQVVALSANRPATIRYTTDGSAPTTASAAYSSPLTITATATIKYFAVDGAGTASAVTGAAYVITAPAPVTTATPAGGIFSVPQNVTLGCNDGSGPGCGSTYYCLGVGCTPAAVYSGPIAITGSQLLRFYSKDSAGHSEAVSQAWYTVFPGYTGGGGALPGGLGTITTYAGGGVGNGTAGTSAILSYPQGAALDGAGNVYFADTNNNLVRKVSAATGIITTVAGTGSAGYSGDGGPASAAAVNGPQGVAVDGSGNIYIADANNHRIRKVAALTGVISTVAGNGDQLYPGDGSQALVSSISPSVLAVDGPGNIYLVDGSYIRKVDTSGVISTVTGGGTWGQLGDGGSAGSAWLNSPQGIAVDGSGNLYIADTYNQRIRKISASTGIITTVAGDGTAGYVGDGGLATAAQISSPTGVSVDGSGNLYIADRYNYRIRKVAAASGVISTVAGNGAGYSGDGGQATAAAMYPYGVAVDGGGNLYIADRDNGRIRKVTVATGIISTVAGNGSGGYSGDGGQAMAATLAYAQGVATDGSGNLYIADRNNHRIRKVSAGTGVITTIAGNGSAGYSGDLGAATQAALNYPQGIAVDGSGNVFIADTNNCRIRKIDTSGTISTVASNGCSSGGDGGQATAAYLYYPQGVAVDGSGNLYIADTYNNRIRKVDSGGIITTVAGDGTAGYGGDGASAKAAQINNPTWVSVDASGNLYIADYNNHRVRKVTAATGVISTVAGSGNAGYFGDGGGATAANLSNPSGVTVDGGGNLYIADYGNNRVRRVDAASGVILTVAGNWNQGYSGDGGPATLASLSYPQSVAVDGNGNIFIGDAGNNRIRKVGESILYTVTLSPGAHGSIVGPTVVNYGSMPTYTIKPDTGYHVTGATVNGASLGAVSSYSYSSWITSNQTLTASFAINTYTLTFAAGANGTISGTASQTVNYGASATAVTAVPNTGYHLINWTDGSGKILGTATALTVSNVAASMNVKANFALNTYTITTGSGANGTISASQTVNYGANSAAVSVTPNAGYHIASVTVDNVSQTIGNQKSFSVTFSNVVGNHTVNATFTLDAGPRLDVTLGSSNGGAGSVNSSPAGIACTSGTCTHYFASGATVTLFPTPDADSVFSGWSGACTAAAGNCTVTMTADKAVTANFTYAQPARVDGATQSYFSQLQAAYAAAPNGGTIETREFLFTEDLIFGRNIAVFIDGGFDTGYSTSNGVTSLHGTLKVRSGKVTVDRFKIH